MKPVAVLFALPVEAKPFVRMLSNKRKPDGGLLARGFIGNHEVLVGLTGMGRVNAGKVAAQIVSRTALSALIFAGFGGGLSEDLRPRQIIAAESVIDAQMETEQEYRCDAALLQVAHNLDNVLVQSGRVLSLERTTQSVEEKANLRTRYGCCIVDMESAAAAKKSTDSGVPFLAIRAILDPASEHMPDELVNAVDPYGRANIKRLSQSILTTPSLLLDIFRLYHRSRLVSQNIAILLDSLIAHFPMETRDEIS